MDLSQIQSGLIPVVIIGLCVLTIHYFYGGKFTELSDKMTISLTNGEVIKEILEINKGEMESIKSEINQLSQDKPYSDAKINMIEKRIETNEKRIENMESVLKEMREDYSK